MAYKLFRYTKPHLKKFIAYFSNDGEMISFFNNPFELRHSIDISDKNDFKSVFEVKTFIANHGSILFLQELDA